MNREELKRAQQNLVILLGAVLFLLLLVGVLAYWEIEGRGIERELTTLFESSSSSEESDESWNFQTFDGREIARYWEGWTVILFWRQDSGE